MARPPSPGPHSTLPRRLHIRPQQPPRANCQSEPVPEPVPVPSERPLRDGSGRPRASGLTCRSSRAEGRFSGGCPARQGEPCRDPPPCAGRTGRAMGPRPSGEGGRRRGASLSMPQVTCGTRWAWLRVPEGRARAVQSRGPFTSIRGHVTREVTREASAPQQETSPLRAARRDTIPPPSVDGAAEEVRL